MSETVTMKRTLLAGAIKAASGSVGENEIEVIASDATPDRDGDILMASGARLDNYRRNPIILAQHDPSKPIARCTSVGVRGDKLVARIEFPPAGTSATSDEYRRLAKAGIISAVSVGFLPLNGEPLPNGRGYRITSWELAEISLVSVPSNPSALVTAKSQSATPRLDEARRKLAEMKAGMNWR